MRPNRVIPLALALALALAVPAGGCMTMIAGDHQDVLVMSGPPGAVVTAPGCGETATPGVLHLARKHDHVIEVACPGHAPRSIHIASRHDPASWVGSFVFNFLAFGWWSGGIGMVVGVVVDVVHGSVKELEPDAVFVPLEPARAGPTRTAAAPAATTATARPTGPVRAYGASLPR